MLRYALRRFIATVPVMVFVGIFIFSLLYLAPGDPASIIAGDQATAEDLERIRASLGLDRPFLVQFGDWAWRVLHADLGTSMFASMPVSDMIAQRAGATVSLLLLTLTLTLIVAIPLGVLSAWRVGSWFDRMIMGFAVAGFSIPVFVIGYLLAFVLSLHMQWLPVQGYAPLRDGVWRWLKHLILPALTLSFGYIALVARITRASMLEAMRHDCVRTARAKGVGAARILFVHALKNAAIPITTVVGLGIASLIGGAVVTESVFAIPGIGRLTVDAILRRDYPIIQGVVLLFSFIYMIINLLIDISYTILDPRIRY
ncbi:ABC transporter permease [Burkholderia pseudomultivorans]|uniref:Glutathione transport system permease protein GsiC n=1 Tax=Burkholderia pseudomultivorans TaxID=1207504 RepID=A0A6P2N3C5_9BURK|nr:ABC transporter permease [Burkholderia pseudomultivorans]MDR8730113.1 Glutathione transport system permease protein GsiC [Burkholderia pseudomultivorans]MDR8734698.1 Glutathione transport system permease protein GsiC [Burkholderia pseudomultivorans]MDR8740664.1 Glutathione transport system permease protein GsiC [Burkholderia pseudomultivorans]MDR8751671.1 Glutathione transport system permease protein GsiC [Burkholderia pseudomultivorans]MDR8777078.1 Glutathione transport system permease pro